MTQLNSEKLAFVVAQAIAAAMNGGGKSRKRRSDAGFTKQAVAAAQTTDERKAALDAATVVAFTKAGYKDCRPRENILVYGKSATEDKPATGWIAKGRKVRAGEKAVRVKAPGMHGAIPLFHESQTEPLVTEAPQSAA